MGVFCTQSTTTLPDPKSVVSGTQIPEWVSAAGRQLYEQSAEMAASPFPQYTGQRVATYGDALDDQGNRIQVGMTSPTAPTVQDAENFFRQNISPNQNIFNARRMPAVEGYTPPPLTMDDLTDDDR